MSWLATTPSTGGVYNRILPCRWHIPRLGYIVKSIKIPMGRAKVEFAKVQEGARKDIERGF
jgi:hypothetical protein